MPTKTITLQAHLWRSRDDLYAQLLPQLGAPEWHGHNLDALWDSLRDPEMNEISPSFTIEVTGTATLTGDLAKYYSDFKSLLHDLRNEGISVTIDENYSPKCPSSASSSS